MGQGEQGAERRVEILAADHGVGGFNCGYAGVDQFIQRFALENARRNVSRTFVVAAEGRRVAGFYSLAMGEIRFVKPPEKRLPRYPMPVVLLGQLGVDAGFQGKGLGKFLLTDALARAERVNDEAAVYAVRVDATDEKAKAFYLKYGFTPLADQPLQLYLPMKVVAGLRLNA